jgi:hypothetical protein
MASKNTKNAVDGDLLILSELMKHLRIPTSQRQDLIKVVKWGGLAIETWLEQAISKVAKIKRSNKDGEDFVNGWEAKKCTVIYHSHGKGNQAVNREANISNLHAKHGDVLIVAADPLSKELFYFKVPSDEIQGRKSITITFNTNGGAMTKFSARDGSVENSFSWRMWNLYRKKTFRELCKN